EAPLPSDPLNEVGDVDHRVQAAAVDDEVRGRDLPAAPEVLPVPDDVVVEVERIGELVENRTLGVEDDLPRRIGIARAAHPLRELESVGTALGKEVEAMR